MSTINTQRIVLAQRPVGEPKHSDFRIEQIELNELKQGGDIVKNHLFVTRSLYAWSHE